VLTRYRCPPLACLDRGSGRRIRRYERVRPGELIHVDVKKPATSPDGGGRTHGRKAGKRNSQATTGGHPFWAMATCTPPSMITPGWPIPRSCLISARTPPPRS
jgi:hypothetical protein